MAGRVVYMQSYMHNCCTCIIYIHAFFTIGLRFLITHKSYFERDAEVCCHDAQHGPASFGHILLEGVCSSGSPIRDGCYAHIAQARIPCTLLSNVVSPMFPTVSPMCHSRFWVVSFVVVQRRVSDAHVVTTSKGNHM